MPSAAILAKLSPKTQAWTAASHAAGGYSPADIALAAGHVRSEMAYRWLLTTYAGHTSGRDLERVCQLLGDECATLADRRGWRACSERVRDLAVLWVTEALCPRRCYVCRGSGAAFDPAAHQHVSCWRCGGTGRVPWSNAERARTLGCSRAAWRRTWAARLAEVDKLMSVTQSEALRSFSQALS